MKKYYCKLTKNEILNVIVEHFDEINEEYSQILEETNTQNFKKDRAFGKYISMIELLQKLKIF